ncbi:MAG: oligosaccharide flippase family protein [Saprospiraceae bacterium]|nr:oligosaccharide flippase family protein [Saprospiraceae bacterium]
MSLKEKAITGVFWSFTGRIFTLTFEFVVGIILTRMLSPGEFGLIGMVTIFLILSETLMNSGFSQALIRMPVCAEKDFETAFTFNIGISIFLIIILYISAPYVAGFYQNTQLTSIVQVLGAGLIFNAFSFVQRTRLTRDLDFKSLNKISVFSTIGSGSMALFFAFQGYGVWSLVIKTLSRDFLQTLLLMLKSRWIPKIKFYKNLLQSSSDSVQK